MTTASSTFTLANENPLSEGNLWDCPSSTTRFNPLQVVSNAVQATTLGATLDGMARRLSPSFGPNHFSQIQVGAFVATAPARTQQLNACVRLQSGASNGDCYMAAFSGGQTNTTKLYYVDDTGAGTTVNYTEIAAATSSVIGIVANDLCRLEIQGNWLRAFKNGTLLHYGTHTTLTTGQPGFGITTATGGALTDLTGDNWSAGDLVRPYLVGASAAIAATVTNAASITPAFPSGYTAVADDIAVILAHAGSNVAFTTPTGYTIATDGSVTLDDNNTANQRVTVYWRRLQAGDTAQVLSSTGTLLRAARLFILRGCGTTGTPFSLVARNLNATPAATIIFPTITPTVDESLVMLLGAYEDDPTSLPVAGRPTGMETATDALVSTTLGNGAMLMHGFVPQITAGATGILTYTLTGATGTWANSPSVGAVLVFPPPSVAGGVIYTQLERGMGRGMFRGMAQPA